MTASAYVNGNPVIFTARGWVYASDRRPVDRYPNRRCGKCRRRPTRDGRDACLGALPGVKNACCGHGRTREAYVSFDDGSGLRGREAVRYFLVMAGR